MYQHTYTDANNTQKNMHTGEKQEMMISFRHVHMCTSILYTIYAYATRTTKRGVVYVAPASRCCDRARVIAFQFAHSFVCTSEERVVLKRTTIKVESGARVRL